MFGIRSLVMNSKSVMSMMGNRRGLILSYSFWG